MGPSSPRRRKALGTRLRWCLSKSSVGRITFISGHIVQHFTLFLFIKPAVLFFDFFFAVPVVVGAFVLLRKLPDC